VHLQDLDNLLEELLAWLEGLENTLNALEAEPLPDDRATLEMLIADHREFMENTSRRQNEVDRVCKARQIKPIKDARKISKVRSPAPTYVFIDMKIDMYNVDILIKLKFSRFCEIWIHDVDNIHSIVFHYACSIFELLSFICILLTCVSYLCQC